MGGFEQVRWKWSHFHHHSYTIFTTKEEYDYENNSPRPTEPIRFIINFLPFGSLLNIQKIRHFAHFEMERKISDYIRISASDATLWKLCYKLRLNLKSTYISSMNPSCMEIFPRRQH